MINEATLDLIMRVGVIPALFIWLLMDTRKEYKQERADSKKREDALMDHIIKSDQTQREITDSIKEISTSQTHVQNSLVSMQKDIEDLKRGERD